MRKARIEIPGYLCKEVCAPIAWLDENYPDVECKFFVIDDRDTHVYVYKGNDKQVSEITTIIMTRLLRAQNHE